MPKDTLSRVVDDLAGYAARLDPDCMTTAQAAHAYRRLCEAERFCTAAKALLAGRAAESQVWKDEGHRTPAEWMAHTSGTGMGEAIATLETARRLEALPATTDALRRGELSSPQAREIAAAAAHRPQAEAELIKTAATSTLKGLKDECRRVRATRGSAAEENERYLAIYARRSFRYWSDEDGAFRGDLTLTPDEGARVLAAVLAQADERFDQARKAGLEEPAAAHRADAVVDLITGAQRPQKHKGRVEMSVHVDATALRRGHVDPGEMCEIRGVGPVPVATATSLLPEAFVKVVIKDGVDIASVCHVGRTIPAVLRTALEARDPTCRVPGCDMAVGLEIDHFGVPFGAGGETRLDNLARLCHFHHALKTYRGYDLTGGPGKWAWDPPPEFASRRSSVATPRPKSSASPAPDASSRHRAPESPVEARSSIRAERRAAQLHRGGPSRDGSQPSEDTERSGVPQRPLRARSPHPRDSDHSSRPAVSAGLREIPQPPQRPVPPPKALAPMKSDTQCDPISQTAPILRPPP